MALQPSQRAAMRGQFKTQAKPNAKQLRRMARMQERHVHASELAAWRRWMKEWSTW